jgi:hypothetical protein
MATPAELLTAGAELLEGEGTMRDVVDHAAALVGAMCVPLASLITLASIAPDDL